MIKTKKNKISSKDYIIIVFRNLFRDSWHLVLLAITIILLFTTIDSRWLLVLLDFIFIFIPFLIAYLYIWHGMEPEVRLSTSEKTIIIEDTGITLHFSNKTEHFLRWNELEDVHIHNEYIIFTFKKRKYLYFVLSRDSFQSDYELKNALKLIANHIPLTN